MSQTSRGSVMVVDDEVALLTVLVETLREAGYHVRGFSAPAPALEALRLEGCDTLLTDLMLPDLDGIGLLQAAYAINPNLVGIIMTGQGTVQTAVEAMKLGAYDYVLKPFKLATLLPILDRGVDLGRLRIENFQLRETAAIHALSQAMAVTLDSHAILEETVAAVAEQTEADEVSILLLTPAGDELVVSAVRGVDRTALIGQRVGLGHDIAGWVAAHQEPLLLNGAVHDARFQPLWPRPSIRSSISLPMLSGGILVGVLTLNRLNDGRLFSDTQLKALQVVANTAAAAVRNASLFAAAEASEKRFRALVEHSADGVALTGADGLLQYVSPAAVRLLGYTSEEAVGTAPAEYIHPDDLPAVLESLGRLFQAPEQVATARYRYRHKDGAWRWLEASISNLLAEPAVGAFVFNYRDITEQVEAVARLAASETRFRALIENSADVIELIDPDGAIVYISPATTRILGYSVEEIEGRTAFDLVHPDHRAALGKSRAEALARPGVAIAAGALVLAKDGAWRWLEGTLTNLLDTPGVNGIVLNFRDMTDQRAADEQVRFHANLLDRIGQAVIATDLAGRITFWNQYAETMYDWTKAEVIGRLVVDVTPSQVSREKSVEIMRLLGAGQSWEGEFVVQRRDGSTFPALVTSSPVYDNQGQMVGIVGVSLDITERKRAEAAVVESEDKFRYIFDNSMVGKSLTLPTGELRVNEALATMVGYSMEELHGRTFGQITHPDDVAANLAVVAALVAGEQESARFTKRYLHKNGSIVWADVGTSLRRDSDGRPAYFITSVLDITERQQHERELEAIAIVSAALRAADTRAKMLAILLEQVTQLVEASAASVILRDPGTADLVVVAGWGVLEATIGRHIPAGTGIAGRVLATRQAYLTADIKSDPYFYDGLEVEQPSAVVCVPLITQADTLGALWAGRAAAFTEGELRVLRAIGDIAANAIQRASLYEQTEQRLRRLAALREIDGAIMGSLDLGVTLSIILPQVTSQLGVAAADVLLLNRAENMLEYAAGHGFRSTGLEQTRLRLGEGYPGQAALERKIVRVADLAAASPVFQRAALLAVEGFVSYFCTPLIAKGQVVGVLEIFQRGPLNPDPEWLGFLETLAGQTAIAVVDARLFDDLQRSNSDMVLAYDTTLEGWSAALDLRDKETEGHSQRVTEVTLKLARALGVGETELEHMRRGALLHDIGKMGIPDAILLKPGPLTDEEWVIMRQHPTLANQLLAPIAFLWQALDIPYCHHEKWDGTGYPRGLKGEQIPFSARIFAVVDVWDALSSDRPYRAAWPAPRVLDHIRSLAGSHFDPRVVQAFLDYTSGGTSLKS